MLEPSSPGLVLDHAISSERPLVSILMVARNTAPFVDAALRSAREQTLREIEVVFVDDGSTDGTTQIAQDHAAQDSRVRVLTGPQRGLSAVRNVSLSAARGAFALVLDSDDLLHPQHVARLVAAQRVQGHEVCVANMLEFGVSNDRLQAQVFASGPPWQMARDIGLHEYLERGMVGDGDISLGYFKPLIDLRFLRHHALTYDERLRIGEDLDLVLRAMLAGGRMLYLPRPTYFYRRHAASTSHRIPQVDCEALVVATDGYAAAASTDPALLPLIAARRCNLVSAARHAEVVGAIKQSRFLSALRLLAIDRAARRMMWRSVAEGLARRVGYVPRSHAAATYATLGGGSEARTLIELADAMPPDSEEEGVRADEPLTAPLTTSLAIG